MNQNVYNFVQVCSSTFEWFNHRFIMTDWRFISYFFSVFFLFSFIMFVDEKSKRNPKNILCVCALTFYCNYYNKPNQEIFIVLWHVQLKNIWMMEWRKKKHFSVSLSDHPFDMKSAGGDLRLMWTNSVISFNKHKHIYMSCMYCTRSLFAFHILWHMY